MDELARVAPLPPSPAEAPVLVTPTSRVFLVGGASEGPAGTDALLPLPDGGRVAYVLDGEGAPALLDVNPFLRGNAFHPLHASPRAESALVSVAASRRMDAGPESERVIVALRGRALLSLENGDVLKLDPHTVAFVRAGEPARVWAQGPEDFLAVVFQPRQARAPRRTLASEIARRRAAPE